MKTILHSLRPALVSTLILALVCCGLYPVAVTLTSQLVFPSQANGSLISSNNTIQGSSLLARDFTTGSYFHPRPSSAGANGYDASASSGSNLGPTSQKLADLIRDRVAAYRASNNLPDSQAVPADAVTASASGLDPHITPANATLQSARVAKSRNLSPEKIQQLIAANTDKATFGFLGEDGVNVLKLNLALDANTKP